LTRLKDIFVGSELIEGSGINEKPFQILIVLCEWQVEFEFGILLHRSPVDSQAITQINALPISG